MQTPVLRRLYNKINKLTQYILLVRFLAGIYFLMGKTFSVMFFLNKKMLTCDYPAVS